MTLGWEKGQGLEPVGCQDSIRHPTPPGAASDWIRAGPSVRRSSLAPLGDLRARNTLRHRVVRRSGCRASYCPILAEIDRPNAADGTRCGEGARVVLRHLGWYTRSREPRAHQRDFCDRGGRTSTEGLRQAGGVVCRQPRSHRRVSTGSGDRACRKPRPDALVLDAATGTGHAACAQGGQEPHQTR